MDKCAYLVNSTPKYYYLLPLHFTLIRRYAPFITFTLILATEEPEHPICKHVSTEFGVEILPLKKEEEGFLDSRAAALRKLALSGRFLFVLPMQEDFLLDRIPDWGCLTEAVSILESSKNMIASVRLMPCPGPKGPLMESAPIWAGITPTTDTYGFTFQCTIWRLEACVEWYRALTLKLEKEWPKDATPKDMRTEIEVRRNFAENAEGQRFFWKFFAERKQTHIGYIRAGAWSNAVYLSPWPYRPTAIVKGKLEPWAGELAQREGIIMSYSG